MSRKSYPTAWIIGGLVTAILVAVGIWAYPEARRTIRMHNM